MNGAKEIKDGSAEEPSLKSREAKDAVFAMLGSQLRTTLSDGRVVQGRLQCMDRLTNFILADAVETGTAATAGGGTGDSGRSGVGSGGDGHKDEGSESSSKEGQPGAQQRHLGVVMIPGKHLVKVERLGGGGRPDEREKAFD